MSLRKNTVPFTDSRKKVNNMTSSKAIVISAFPGTGKTASLKLFPEFEIQDSDSSLFSWSSPGVRHPDFPNNYIEHIKSKLDTCNFIMVSSHKQVRDALDAAGIEFILVYPELECREEYLERYRTRGSDACFIAMMEKNFEMFVNECKQHRPGIHVPLKPGLYMSDVVKMLCTGVWSTYVPDRAAGDGDVLEYDVVFGELGKPFQGRTLYTFGDPESVDLKGATINVTPISTSEDDRKRMQTKINNHVVFGPDLEPSSEVGT